jgi:hypothetical protein
MEPIVIVQGITVDQLLNRIQTSIKKEFRETLDELTITSPIKYLTRTEAASLLHISLPTLGLWTKWGGSRVIE